MVYSCNPIQYIFVESDHTDNPYLLTTPETENNFVNHKKYSDERQN